MGNGDPSRAGRTGLGCSRAAGVGAGRPVGAAERSPAPGATVGAGRRAIARAAASDGDHPRRRAISRAAPPIGRAPASFRPADLRLAVTEGRESNLVLFVVDASGSMAARRRMDAVKAAVAVPAPRRLSAPRQGRLDHVPRRHGHRGATAHLVGGKSRLDGWRDLPTGGRTPLAEVCSARRDAAQERIRDPRRRPLLVLVTDGRATSGPTR